MNIRLGKTAAVKELRVPHLEATLGGIRITGFTTDGKMVDIMLPDDSNDTLGRIERKIRQRKALMDPATREEALITYLDRP